MMMKEDHIIIIEFLQAFSCFFFDVKDIGYGCMTVEELVTVIRSALDQNPTSSDEEEETHDDDDDDEVEENDIIEFTEFLDILLLLMAGQTKQQLHEEEEDIIINNNNNIEAEAEAEDELKEAFKVFDKDEDGFISANELRLVMMNFGEKLTDEEVEHMIKEADLDGDGKLNFHEFLNIIALPFPPPPHQFFI